jgi:hypothetical protein
MEFDINNQINYDIKSEDFTIGDDGNLYYDITKIKVIDMIITAKSIEDVKKYSTKNEVKKWAVQQSIIRYIICIYDNSQKYIIASKLTLWEAIRAMLLLYVVKDPSSIATRFNNVLDIKCKLLGIVKLTKSNNLAAQLETIKNKYKLIDINNLNLTNYINNKPNKPSVANRV